MYINQTSALETEGFAIIPRVLSSQEITTIINSLNSSPLPRSRAGIRHAMRHPAVAEFANSTRLLELSQRLLGEDAIPFRATLFDKSPGANWLVVWHQDTALPLRERREVAGWGPWSMKDRVTYAHAPATALSKIVALRVHLDDSTAGNGPLRALPGTHKRGVLTDGEIRQLATQIPAVDCVVPAGGILAMRPLLVHSSHKSLEQVPRRVLHIEYAASPSVDDGLELAIA